MSRGTMALLVALRIAIGWHFLYEGLWKIDSDTGAASYTTSWYPLYHSVDALRRDLANGATPDPARVDAWYDEVLRGLRGRNLAPSDEQRARLAELRDRLKLAAASPAGGERPRQDVEGLDWLYLRDEVLRLPADPPPQRFTSLPFLQASAGPFRPFFRALVPDIDGFGRLSVAAAQAAIERRFQQILAHYAAARRPFTAEQRERLTRARDELKAAIAATLTEPPVSSRIADYKRMRQRPVLPERDVAFAQERQQADSAKLDTTADELVALVNEPLLELSAEAQRIATADQLAAGPLPRPRDPAAWIDWTVRWGLTAIGLGLMLGLLTPVAAVAAALQLACFYLASPPWPGLPAAGLGGHYLYVDRNLIEMLAALVVAVSGTGRWLGLDALLARRRWRAQPPAPQTSPAAEGAATP